MAIRDTEGNIVTSKKQKTKKIVTKDIRLVGRSFEYIGKVSTLNKEIVLYEGIIKSEPNELGMVLVSYLDRSMKRNPNKIIKETEVPIKFLKIL